MRWVAAFESCGFSFMAACLLLSTLAMAPRVTSTCWLRFRGLKVTFPDMCSPTNRMTCIGVIWKQRSNALPSSQYSKVARYTYQVPEAIGTENKKLISGCKAVTCDIRSCREVRWSFIIWWNALEIEDHAIQKISRRGGFLRIWTCHYYNRYSTWHLTPSLCIRQNKVPVLCSECFQRHPLDPLLST